MSLDRCELASASKCRYLTAEEAAELVGIGGNTMRRVIKRREIVWFNVGTAERPRVRIRESDLHAWMESRASQPQDETSSL